MKGPGLALVFGLAAAGVVLPSREGGQTVQNEASAPSGLTAVDGLKVGHFTRSERPTGCTVILAEAGAVAGVDVRGAAPGTSVLPRS